MEDRPDSRHRSGCDSVVTQALGKSKEIVLLENDAIISTTSLRMSSMITNLNNCCHSPATPFLGELSLRPAARPKMETRVTIPRTPPPPVYQVVVVVGGLGRSVGLSCVSARPKFRPTRPEKPPPARRRSRCCGRRRCARTARRS